MLSSPDLDHQYSLAYEELRRLAGSNVGIVRTQAGPGAAAPGGNTGRRSRSAPRGHDILIRHSSPAMSFVTTAKADLVTAWTALGRPEAAARFR